MSIFFRANIFNFSVFPKGPALISRNWWRMMVTDLKIYYILRLLITSRLYFDSLVVFKGNKKVQDIGECLNEFQYTINKAADNQHLQFTVGICKQYKSVPHSKKKYMYHINFDYGFQFLDMNINCSSERDLQFLILNKKVQHLNYSGI